MTMWRWARGKVMRRRRWNFTRTSSTCGWPNSAPTAPDGNAGRCWHRPPHLIRMSDATDHPAYRLFAARYAELRRGRRTETLLTIAIVGLLVLVSIADTEFYPSHILAGIPRIGEYF